MTKDGIRREIFDCVLKDCKAFDESSYYEWNELLNRAAYVPVEYTVYSLKYQHRYMECFTDQMIDISHIVYNNGGGVAVWPLSLKLIGGVFSFTTNEGPVKPPLFIKEVQEKLRKKIIQQCLNRLREIYDFLHNTIKVNISDKWDTFYYLQELRGYDSQDGWYRRCLESGAGTYVINELYCDLTLGKDEIHKKIRKSYHSLINEGSRLWEVEILNKVSPEVFEEYRKKHIEVAGRETRSVDTWNIQRDSINHGSSFLVTLRDNAGVLVGGGFFEISKDEGLYSVGVYDRTLFDKPIAHLVQWNAILYMKELGIKRYKIGRRFYIGDVDVKPTDKELSISYFKEGFSTDLVPKILLKNKIYVE